MQEIQAKWGNSLELWRAAHSPERLAEDEARLKRLFAQAAYVPVLAAALHWAETHGVQFIVDHTVRAAGHYAPGTGVVALSRNSVSEGRESSGVGVAVHETRHAWQDYYGMLPTGADNFQLYNICNALMEADAEAHGSLASLQHRVNTRDKNSFLGASFVAPLQEQLAQQNGYLWERFSAWFDDWRAQAYGQDAANEYGAKWGIKGAAAPRHNFEYDDSMHAVEPLMKGLDFNRPEQLRRLGKSFNNENYFNAGNIDFFYKKILQTSLTLKFYTASLERPLPMVNEIRKRELAHKLKNF